MGNCSQYRNQYATELLANILCQKSQHGIAILLQQHVFAAIAPVGIGVGKKLAAVQLDRHASFNREQIHFHFSPAVEGNRQFSIHGTDELTAN